MSRDAQSSAPFLSPQRLSEYVLDQAAWRYQQSQRFPEDSRNARAALALRQLAAFIDGLRTTDARLTQLFTLGAFDEVGTFVAGAGANVKRTVARYGFDRDPDPDLLLHELFIAVAEDRKKRRRGNVIELDGPRGRVTVTLEPSRDRAPGEREILAELFIQAGSYDRACVSARIAMERAGGGYRAPERAATVDRERVGEALAGLVDAFAHLAAAVTPAALSRLDVLSSFGATSEAARRVSDMGQEELELLLRPIFEEAGIGERFLTMAEAAALYEQGDATPLERP